MTVDEAVAAGVGSLVIGVAPVGGVIPDSWWAVIEQAARAGLDVVCGLHVKLADNPALVAAAKASGARLVDVRVPPKNLPVGTGVKRSGRRVLTVGTDCAIGKKYTALALDRAMREAGMNSTFRATGQTGIMIAGEGMPIDAVVADFISGAAELPVARQRAGPLGRHRRPGLAVPPRLLRRQPGPAARLAARRLRGLPRRQPAPTFRAGSTILCPRSPSASSCTSMAGRRTNPGHPLRGHQRQHLRPAARPSGRPGWPRLAAETGLPCVDPLIDGCGAIVDLHSRTMLGVMR